MLQFNLESVQRCEGLTRREEGRKERIELKCDDISEIDGNHLPWEGTIYIGYESLVAGCCSTYVRLP